MTSPSPYRSDLTGCSQKPRRGGCEPEDLEAMQQQLTETEAKLAAVTAELAKLKNQPDYKLLYDQLIEKLLDR